MINLKGIQAEVKEWRDRNFPGADIKQRTLGVCEEAGELAHVVLKQEQAIRGYDDEAVALAGVKDATGDLVIFLMGVCDFYGFDLDDAIKETWNHVRQRDWLKNREDGGESSVAETATDWGKDRPDAS